MEFLVWAGTLVSLLGVAGLIRCVIVALRARREGLEGEEMHSRLQRATMLNMAALCVSAIGLMLVTVGVLLG